MPPTARTPPTSWPCACPGLLALRGIDLAAIDGCITSSVVPRLNPEYTRMCTEYLGAACLMVGPGVRTGMAVRLDNPHELGADRLVNAVAAFDRFGGPCAVVDFGTAITFDAISAGGEYLGGVIGPGVQISMEALTERAARLPMVDLAEPSGVIGRTTQASLQSGMVYGFAGAIDAIAGRIRAELGEETSFVATGGMAAAIVPYCELIDEVDDLLTLNGPAADLRAERRMSQPPLTEPFEIGGVRIANRVLLAPLAGIGNWFVRLQARRHGAGLAVSEMVSSFGLHHRNERTLRELMRIHPDEHPVAMQLFGHDPEVMRSGGADRRRGGRRPDRHQHGLPGAKGAARPAPARRCCATPSWPLALVRGAAEGGGLPVTVKLRSGLERGDRSGFRAGPAPGRGRGRRDRLPPAPGGGRAQGPARLRPGPRAGRAASTCR